MHIDPTSLGHYSQYGMIGSGSAWLCAQLVSDIDGTGFLTQLISSGTSVGVYLSFAAYVIAEWLKHRRSMQETDCRVAIEKLTEDARVAKSEAETAKAEAIDAKLKLTATEAENRRMISVLIDHANGNTQAIGQIKEAKIGLDHVEVPSLLPPLAGA